MNTTKKGYLLLFLVFGLFISAKFLMGYSAIGDIDVVDESAPPVDRSKFFAYSLSILIPGGGHLYLRNYDYFSRYFALETTTPVLAYFLYGSLNYHIQEWQNAKTKVARRTELNWVTFYGVALYSTALIWFGSKFADLRAINGSLQYYQKFQPEAKNSSSGFMIGYSLKF